MRLARLDTTEGGYAPDKTRKAHMAQRVGWAVFLSIVLVAALFILTMVVDGEGRKGYHHTVPLPAKVIEISHSQYIVLDKATDATRICTGPVGSSYDRIEATRDLKVEGADATYVRCGHEQYWDDHRAESVNLLHAGQKVLFNPFTVIGGGLFLLFLWSFPIRYHIAWERWETAKARAEQDEREKEQIKETHLRELAAAEQMIRFDRLKSELVGEWSKPETNLSDSDFERKLGDLEAKRARGEL